MNKIGVRKEREKKGKEGAEREGKERKYKVKSAERCFILRDKKTRRENSKKEENKGNKRIKL